jgi:TRAP-type C4-dicarboxylate transport system permease small subunit
MMQNNLNSFLRVVTNILDYIGSAALAFMMFLTVADVMMRAFGHPIIGTYEVVGLLLAVVIGFTIPKVSYDKGHVYMEVGVDHLPPKQRSIVQVFTRTLCFFLFFAIGYKLISAGNEFRTSGQVSPTIQLPFYPFAYGVAICCFIQCLVFCNDIVSIWRRGQHE